MCKVVKVLVCNCEKVYLGAVGVVVWVVRWWRSRACVATKRESSTTMDVGRAREVNLGKKDRNGMHQNESHMDTHGGCVE